MPPPASFFPPPPQTLPPAPGKAIDKRTSGVNHQNGNASLHSSNDSGFSNDPPPAPEIDYSDDENTRLEDVFFFLLFRFRHHRPDQRRT